MKSRAPEIWRDERRALDELSFPTISVSDVIMRRLVGVFLVLTTFPAQMNTGGMSGL